MITGRQIREARALLELSRSQLAARARSVTTATITRAELVDDEPPITVAQADAIKEALERAGIEFIFDGSDAAACVKLRRRET